MKDKFKETLTHILSYLLKVERRTLLWTNSSPTAYFSAQTISLDLSGYDMVEVSFMLWTGYQQTSNTMRCKVGAGAIVTAVASSNNYAVGSYPDPLARGMAASVTGVQFGGGVESNPASGSNTYKVADHVLIPYQIYGIKSGGVLRSPVISRLCAILQIGGGVDEGDSRKIVSEHTLTADIDNAPRYIKRIIHNDIYDKWEYKRLQNVDRYGIVELFQSMDNRNRYKGIYNEYPTALSVIGDRIFCLQSVIRLCIANANSSSGKRLWYNWNNSNWYSLTHSERRCVA